jgi:hypothetical protein
MRDIQLAGGELVAIGAASVLGFLGAMALVGMWLSL